LGRGNKNLRKEPTLVEHPYPPDLSKFFVILFLLVPVAVLNPGPKDYGSSVLPLCYWGTTSFLVFTIYKELALVVDASAQIGVGLVFT
jgi:hypothetical protein